MCKTTRERELRDREQEAVLTRKRLQPKCIQQRPSYKRVGLHTVERQAPHEPDRLKKPIAESAVESRLNKPRAGSTDRSNRVISVEHSMKNTMFKYCQGSFMSIKSTDSTCVSPLSGFV